MSKKPISGSLLRTQRNHFFVCPVFWSGDISEFVVPERRRADLAIESWITQADLCGQQSLSEIFTSFRMTASVTKRSKSGGNGLFHSFSLLIPSFAE